MFRINPGILKDNNRSVFGMCLLLVLVQAASIWHEVKHGGTSSNHEHHHEHFGEVAVVGLRPEHIGYTLPAAVEEHPDCSLCSLHAGEGEYFVSVEKKYQRSLSQLIIPLPSLTLPIYSYHQNARAPPIS